MPVKEREEVLVEDIEADLERMRAGVIGAKDMSVLGTWDFQGIHRMYKNPQQQVVFIRTVYTQIVQEALRFLSEGRVEEAMVNICILDEVFLSQEGRIDVEMSLEGVESINQHVYRVGKGESSAMALDGARGWNGLKKRKAIRICVTPFPDDEQSLMLIEQELESISRTLDCWDDVRDAGRAD